MEKFTTHTGTAVPAGGAAFGALFFSARRRAFTPVRTPDSSAKGSSPYRPSWSATQRLY